MRPEQRWRVLQKRTDFGKEAAAYLQYGSCALAHMDAFRPSLLRYRVDFYDDLPAHTVFLQVRTPS
jgi:hypothetical protein